MSALEPMMIGPQSYNTKSVWRAGNPWPHNHWTLDHGTQEKGPWKRNPGPKLPRPQTTWPILKGEEMRLLSWDWDLLRVKKSKTFRTARFSGHFLVHPDTFQIIQTHCRSSTRLSGFLDTFQIFQTLSDHPDAFQITWIGKIQIIKTIFRLSGHLADHPIHSLRNDQTPKPGTKAN